MLSNILRKSLFVNGLLFVVSTMLTLCFAEFLVRAFMPQYKIWDTELKLVENGMDLRCVPNTSFIHNDFHDSFSVQVDINQYGFRDKKNWKDSRVSDYIFLGDSFTFGYGVEEEERFGDIFQYLTFDSLKAFNLGIPSCHFINYKTNLDFAVQHGLKAKKMVLSVCMENDLLNYNLLKDKKSQDQRDFKRWLHEHSALYGFIGQKIRSSKALESFLYNMGLVKNSSNPSLFLTSDEIIESSADYLLEIVREYDVLIIIIPSRMIRAKDYQAGALATHFKFIEALKKRSLKVLDIKEIFDQSNLAPLTELRFESDGHWTPIGHKLVGEAIFNKLFNDEK